MSQTIKGTFFFDPADLIYLTHFPGYPVVPGSMIVHAFAAAAGGRLGSAEEGWSIDKFKFRRFVSPGEYPFEIQISDDHVKCTLYDHASIAATGILKP